MQTGLFEVIQLDIDHNPFDVFNNSIIPSITDRLFGNTGLCAACNKVIPAFEMVMKARSNVYHLECFACQQCNHR